MKIRLMAEDVSKEKIAMIRSLCQGHRGKSSVHVSVKTARGRVFAAADKRLSVNANIEFCKKMKQLVGEENFQLSR